jgi:nitroreductase
MKEPSMDVSEAIRERRSIRAFLPDDVSDDTIREVLDEARWAPSWANAQGWDVFVVKGDKLSQVKEMLAEKSTSEAESVTDIPMPQRGEWPEHMQERMTYQPALAQPPERPGLWRIYDAPCLLILGIHEQLAVEYACFSLGLLAENICLAAHSRGLGTCIMAMAVKHADALHELLPQAEGHRFVVGVAFGHPDQHNALNRTERRRCAFGEIVKFVE